MFALNLSRVCAVFDLFKNPWGAATGGHHAPSARFSAGAPPGGGFLPLLGGQRLEMPLHVGTIVFPVDCSFRDERLKFHMSFFCE